MVTEKDVSYVADLAYLELTQDERARMLKDLNSILGYIDRLNELSTSDVEPMAQVASRYGTGETPAVMRLSLPPCGPTNRALRCRTTKRCAMRRRRMGLSSKCPK